MCRSVEWGMETEYKYIGIKKDLTGLGRKKTECKKGKELNHDMKDIMRYLKMNGF